MRPTLWFVTPVWRRFYLTKVCLEQRRQLCDALPFEANCVVVGDDENLEVAHEYGFPTVEMNNEYVGRKFNAGYRYAYENGATHIMPIGSDSWLHPSIFKGEAFAQHKALGIVGLSSFSPDGNDRIDLAVKYPAGFGVGMVYPAEALYAERLNFQACEPKRNRGCDNSTWSRVGRGRVPIRFMEEKRHCYINFHSVDESITDFRLIQKSSQRIREHARRDPLGPLYELYGGEMVDKIETMYALRALQVFITGKTPQFENRFGRPKRSYPAVAGRRPTAGRKQGQSPIQYDKIAERRRRKERGLTLTRDEEMSLKFADLQGI